MMIMGAWFIAMTVTCLVWAWREVKRDRVLKAPPAPEPIVNDPRDWHPYRRPSAYTWSRQRIEDPCYAECPGAGRCSNVNAHFWYRHVATHPADGDPQTR